eukprot:332323-Pyramimonas_sp.AAC.1
MVPGSTCPGEEGHAAEVAKGNLPPRSQEFKMVKRTAKGEAWLAFQLLQKPTKTPPLEPSSVIPNWARFVRIKADRSRADPAATVAD